MVAALGLSVGSGKAFTSFISGKTISKCIGCEFERKIKNPIIFQITTRENAGYEITVFGYYVTILIDVCAAILSADAIA